MSSPKRSRAPIAVGAAILIASGILVGVRIGGGEKGSPQQTIWGEPRSSIEFRAQPGQSPEYVAAMQRIRNELPYEPSWSDEDIAFVIGEMETDVSDVSRHVEAGEQAPTLDEPVARGMAERDIRKTFSVLITAEVLWANQPMSDDGRRRLEAMLTALLEHPDPYYRRLGLDAMFDSGLIKQDAVYQWINEIAANDSDKFTRERASYLLNEYDIATLSAKKAEDDEGS